MNRPRFVLSLIILLPLARVSYAAPASQAASHPSTRPTTRADLTPQQQKAMKIVQLTRKAIEQFRAGKFKEVEETLMEALALDPDNSLNIYNMACAKSRLGKIDDALAYLERAADAGYTDFIHMEQDPDLEALRNQPKFKRLLASKDLYQKKEADRAMGTLKAQFGTKYLYELDPENKLLFVANTDPQTLADVKKWLGAQAKSQRQMLFSHKPDQYVTILLPSLADFRKIIRQPNVEGIYMHEIRTLIARRLGQVMTHEFTHAMHAGDLAPLAQEHPIWVVEGLASLFESGQFEGETLVPRDNYRLWFLQTAARTKTLIPLERLITWKQPQFVNNPNLAYGESSSVMLYLYEKGLLKKFYDEFKVAFDGDPTGKKTLEKVTGTNLAGFEKDWREWMMKRTPPATSTGPDGAFLGVRFSQETDGLKIDEVVRGGPAEKAGMKLADVLVGLNELEVRDQHSLIPALKEFKPGDTVNLKVRRGQEFVTLAITLGRRDGRAPVATRPATRGAAGSKN